MKARESSKEGGEVTVADLDYFHLHCCRQTIHSTNNPIRIAIAPPNRMLGRTWDDSTNPVADSALPPSSLMAAERIACGEVIATPPRRSMMIAKINSATSLVKPS
jgi:hypothetical protein